MTVLWVNRGHEAGAVRTAQLPEPEYSQKFLLMFNKYNSGNLTQSSLAAARDSRLADARLRFGCAEWSNRCGA
jgi:hypothetical protein